MVLERTKPDLTRILPTIQEEMTTPVKGVSAIAVQDIVVPVLPIKNALRDIRWIRAEHDMVALKKIRFTFPRVAPGTCWKLYSLTVAESSNTADWRARAFYPDGGVATDDVDISFARKANSSAFPTDLLAPYGLSREWTPAVEPFVIWPFGQLIVETEDNLAIAVQVNLNILLEVGAGPMNQAPFADESTKTEF